MRKILILFVNVTRQCNVDCRRCFLTKEHRMEAERIDTALFAKLKGNPALDHDDLTIMWEGGEPTVVGEDFFRQCIKDMREALPKAKHSMVTNLFTMPDWMIDIIKREFDGKVETTFAMGGKASLSGSEELYLKSFSKSMGKLVANDIACPVNLETNRETVRQGAMPLVNFLMDNKIKVVDFDLSVSFNRTMDNQPYNKQGYPILEGNVSYKEVSDYLISICDEHYFPYMREQGVTIPLIELMMKGVVGHDNSFFNVQMDQYFLTINPDGTLCSNPLFSDLTNTYLGNLTNNDLDQILLDSHGAWVARSSYEVKRSLDPKCQPCEYYTGCKGGASHIIAFDGSGECAGLKSLRDYLKTLTAP